MSLKVQHLAAVDLGSNSFRMLVGKAAESPHGAQIYPLDSLREPVRLGAGLDENKSLTEESQQRALATLRRFGERLRQFHPERVRAVATNAVRVAKNAPAFLERAQQALGFPIEVIAGREEARLVYIGAAHSVTPSAGHRLVVDIGGGSTEFIIGSGLEPRVMESLYIGCVSMTREFFPAGRVDEQRMKSAELAARREIQIIARGFRKTGWASAVGSSGTARALADILVGSQLNDSGASLGITRGGLRRLRKIYVQAEDLSTLRMPGLKPDRLPVAAGGLAIMLAVFEELGLKDMEATDAGLRLGVLYDLLGREQQQDMRELTVQQFTERYAVDARQAARVEQLALALLEQLDPLASPERRQALRWAAQLHEVGLSISHSAYHKHSAYIVGNADMPGFSRSEQAAMAEMLLCHGGKLKKLGALTGPPVDLRSLLALRLAVLLARNRRDVELDGGLRLVAGAQGVSGTRIEAASRWLRASPLTQYSLEQEVSEWQRVGLDLQLQLQAQLVS
ncbi:MAG: exopolyphosphatase [Betaproteobacteria bacterium]|jgi:exopolyphosphatase/guanosine-5'-triphosphate,3'-diphosphate pyrophosphatase|nr:exopolyphosphatase [Betaproteobacteria bacterium]MBU6512840.1 exopolyphosphatase [Betaproteobacteria bacterium]MDE2152625.1 exopolyphosphatase [Betaproteobacteria bacterium]MDE2480524.1 exopolyphosphatase [Betaproteobacteria bacterium]